MFLSHRDVRLDALGVRMCTHALVHSAYRVHVVVRENVVCEDALIFRGFERKGAVGRPVVTAMLGGRARLRAFGIERWVGAGDLTMISHKSQIEMRQESPYESVVIEWEPGSLGAELPHGFSAKKMTASCEERLRAFATTLPQNLEDSTLAATGLCAVLRALSAEGVPFRDMDPAELVEPVPAQTRAVARALDELHSSLADKPMAVDLDDALALSSRQVNRVVAAFNERFGYNAAGWRDTRNRWRLFVGATLMTAPDATAERVAKAVGYASTATFCRALADAGLPPPSSIAEAVSRLGATS
jgi:AraC-like DNA-binding protein